MKNVSLFPVVFAALTAMASAPRATVTGVSADESAMTLTVTYTLDKPAVVTADFLTNGVSVGAGSFRSLSGDVNRYVTDVSSPRSFAWKIGAHGDWGGGADVDVRLTAWSMNCPPDYMAMNLVEPGDVRFYVSEEAIPLGVQHLVYKSDIMLMRKITAAGITYRMGSGDDGHLVTLTNDFYIGVYPVTQIQWKTVTGQSAASSHTDEAANRDRWLYPSSGISYDALRGSTDSGINWPETGRFGISPGSRLQQFRDLTGIPTLDLPTEAEWEYACRAGTAGHHYNCVGSQTGSNTTEIAWYVANSAVNGRNRPHPVGLKKPNAWGLYDMLGNMHEWCMDWRGGAYGFADPDVPVVAPTGVATGKNRVKRGGGSYEHSIHTIYSWKRDWNEPSNASVYNGFRMYCPVPSGL